MSSEPSRPPPPPAPSPPPPPPLPLPPPLARVSTIDCSTPGAAQAIRQALTTLGCFYATGLGVRRSTVSALLSQSRAFFSLPLETKMKIKSDANFRGYTPMNDETSCCAWRRGPSGSRRRTFSCASLREKREGVAWWRREEEAAAEAKRRRRRRTKETRETEGGVLPWTLSAPSTTRLGPRGRRQGSWGAGRTATSEFCFSRREERWREKSRNKRDFFFPSLLFSLSLKKKKKTPPRSSCLAAPRRPF